MTRNEIVITGARESNLKNIDLTIPKNKLIVFTGVSGSGKTALAFDTLYQEGQRRYIESLSSYARQFLGSFEKPDVLRIDGLSPSISIDQRTTSSNPRSTVGTVTEIYDYLRLLYARVGVPYDPKTNKPLTKQTINEMTQRVINLDEGLRVEILAPIVSRQKGSHKKLFENLIKEGFFRVYINDEMSLIEELEELDKNKYYNIDVVIDRLSVKEDNQSRVYSAMELATKLSNGKVKVIVENQEPLFFNEQFSSTDSDFTIPNLEPRLFSFNTPIGACSYCNGLGFHQEMDPFLMIDPEKPLLKGGIIPLRHHEQHNATSQELIAVCNHFKISMDEAVKDIDKKLMDIVLYGTNEIVKFKYYNTGGTLIEKEEGYEGVINMFNRRYNDTTSNWIKGWLDRFITETTCSKCKGARLNEQALSVKIADVNIYDATTFPIIKLRDFVLDLKLDVEQEQIAKLLRTEITERLQFLIDVGLNYLNLARQSATLSGGEAQRIRLATQIGATLSGVLYVLDEPSIGLHQKDNEKLINTLIKMRDLGNTLVVVEHDSETMMAADYIVDIGPLAGVHGGEIVAAGTPKQIMNNKKSLTGQYLAGKLSVTTPSSRRPVGKDKIKIVNAYENNLKNLDVEVPLHLFNVVTGVSGSGKSSLINEVLKKGLQQKLYKNKERPGKHDKIEDNKLIKKIVEISQSPIGRTPRSNPATYTGVFDDIRDLYSKTNEAKTRGYLKGRFSFNVKGGRCESCRGDGVKKISMHFLPDVYVMCETCNGSRYNHETLQIKYRGKNIADVLDMTIDEASEFFVNHPKIHHQIQTIQEVGLGYIKLGQSATTLSGGEAQRVKLASELYKKITPDTLYVLDEPTTGLHVHDVQKLINVLHKIVDQEGTVIVIEHNLDVIKNADYVIDLGPEGGDEGGYIIASGTPEEVSQVKRSYTGQYLKEIL